MCVEVIVCTIVIAAQNYYNYSPLHLKRSATLRCNLSLITIHDSDWRYFQTLVLHEVV